MSAVTPEMLAAGIQAALTDPWIKLDIDAAGLRQSGFVERIYSALEAARSPTSPTDGAGEETTLGEDAEWLHRVADNKNALVRVLPAAVANLHRIANRLSTIPTSPREGDDNEHFLTAYVSQDTRVIGIEHPTEADWDDVLRAHITLRDRLNDRIAEQDKCPFSKPVTEANGMREALRNWLPNIAQMLDEIKAQRSQPNSLPWTDWNQAQRDELTRVLNLLADK